MPFVAPTLAGTVNGPPQVSTCPERLGSDTVLPSIFDVPATYVAPVGMVSTIRSMEAAADVFDKVTV